MIDRDQWDPEHTCVLQKRVRQQPNMHLAVSNPCFEYWLLLHFESGDGVAGRQGCLDRLAKRFPGYNKVIGPGDISTDMIRQAVVRARKKHEAQGYPEIPTSLGSTVYLLVQRILDCETEGSN